MVALCRRTRKKFFGKFLVDLTLKFCVKEMFILTREIKYSSGINVAYFEPIASQLTMSHLFIKFAKSEVVKIK